MGLTVAEAPKQPGETRRYGFDFSLTGKLAVGEHLVDMGSTAVITDSADDEDKSADMLEGEVSVNDDKISILVKGGTHGREYNLQFLAATDGGEVLEEDLVIPVEELAT